MLFSIFLSYVQVINKVPTISSPLWLFDQLTARGHTHPCTTNTETVEFSDGEQGKVPANLGLPVSASFFPLTFTQLLFSSLLFHTFSALCGGHKLGAVQTVTHTVGMPDINMWRDRRRKVRGGWERSTAGYKRSRLCTAGEKMEKNMTLSGSRFKALMHHEYSSEWE